MTDIEDTLENYRYDFQELLEKHKKLFSVLDSDDLNEIIYDVQSNTELKQLIKHTKFFNHILKKKYSKNGKPYFGNKYNSICNTDVRLYIIKNNNLMPGYFSRAQTTLSLLKAGFVYKEISRTPQFNIDLKSYNKYFSINDELKYHPDIKKIINSRKNYYSKIKEHPLHIQYKKEIVELFNNFD